MTDWTHDALAIDLAQHARAGGENFAWLDMPVGPAGSVRPDVFTVKRWSYHAAIFITYEVKISVADFRADVTSGKYLEYFKFSSGVTFACPAGLLKLDDVPESCGLIERSARGWRHRRRPTMQKVALALETMIKLISTAPFSAVPFRGGDAQWSLTNYMRERIEEEARSRAMRQIGKRLGKDIAQYLRAPEAARAVVKAADGEARRIVDAAHVEAKRVVDQVESEWREIRVALGIPLDAPRHEARVKLVQRLRSVNADHEVRRLTELLEGIQRKLDDGLAIRRAAEAAA